MALTKGDFFNAPANLTHQVGAGKKGATMLAVSVDSLPLDNPNRVNYGGLKPPASAV